MKRPSPARTYAPVRLADLEPHRFEDLVRNLAYDFRSWTSIEAVGRSGDDGGFDVRAWETENREIDPEGGENEPLVRQGHEWMFQCKREQTIGPKMMEKHLRSLAINKESPPYGLVFVGSCDLSKKAQDTFRDISRELGFQEAYLWGRGEVEDLLYQPKNDHLLFAFFGISIQTRKRSTKTDLRTKLVPKRKLSRVLKDREQNILIRDPLDDRYPYWTKDEVGERTTRWILLSVEGLKHDGVHVLWRRYPAFLDEDNMSWDFIEGYNSAILGRYTNFWEKRDQLSPSRGSYIDHHSSIAQWQELSEQEKAWFTITAVLPYEVIIEIDEDGDDVCSHPHLYVDFSHSERFPFRDYFFPIVSGIQSRFAPNRECKAERENRVKRFKQAPLPPGRIRFEM